ncbi:alcohol dehydrogenase [Kineococcus xinjiangensis]|uniref:Alcohol dehydrogenase n=1 Tax=Kineococcus xinjiangensis TaxID=512762 RepID=A0A2S6IV27_9ACTN|nr:zinc-binding dehydrogenase [Kineococcus xinjiangensis]PPK98132.1 alcohol dehydrogenase [Kineococcus xinjiangensis]
MRALVFERFGGPLEERTVPDPEPGPLGAVVRVEGTGVCRSDWHGWQGHDPDVSLPHVPGHELAGTVVAVGGQVRLWRAGDRVTVPFVNACGGCPQCAAGAHQVCERQRQPGFTHWGSFAELVALDSADVNLVRLPEAMPATTAAALGCRVATAFRAVVDVGAARAGEWVAVHGCGGVGLSAVALAVAVGARVVATDLSAQARELALRFGAEVVVDAAGGAAEVAAAVREATGGGAHVSVDAVGSAPTCEASLLCLRARGRHVQVGLLPPAAGRPVLPLERVIALELQVLGSHGMAAHDYPRLLALVESGRFRPEALVSRVLPLAEGPRALAECGAAAFAGITVLDPLAHPGALA